MDDRNPKENGKFKLNGSSLKFLNYMTKGGNSNKVLSVEILRMCMPAGPYIVLERLKNLRRTSKSDT